MKIRCKLILMRTGAAAAGAALLAGGGPVVGAGAFSLKPEPMEGVFLREV